MAPREAGAEPKIGERVRSLFRETTHIRSGDGFEP
jgi:hypothetical protein